MMNSTESPSQERRDVGENVVGKNPQPPQRETRERAQSVNAILAMSDIPPSDDEIDSASDVSVAATIDLDGSSHADSAEETKEPEDPEQPGDAASGSRVGAGSPHSIIELSSDSEEEALEEGEIPLAPPRRDLEPSRAQHPVLERPLKIEPGVDLPPERPGGADAPQIKSEPVPANVPPPPQQQRRDQRDDRDRENDPNRREPVYINSNHELHDFGLFGALHTRA
jgi:hypothetical protein